MKQRLAGVALVFAIAASMSIGCSDDDSVDSNGGAGGISGASGKGGAGGKAGAGGKGGAGGMTGGGTNGGGTNGGSGGNPPTAGSGNGAAAGEAGSESAGQGGTAGEGSGGEAGESSGGEAGAMESADVVRGRYIVRSVALCGGCHTATGGAELAGNPQFAGGHPAAPNLTPHADGLGSWTDAQIKSAIRDGVDDEGRQLASAMPYWLFHNMSDADLTAVVAFLRSLPPVAGVVGDTNLAATAKTPLAPSALPDTTLASTDADYAAAQRGKYLVSSVAQCVKCHSPAGTNALPTTPYFSGNAPATITTQFGSNITPDVTGIATWTVADVVTALKQGKDKAGTTLCGAMPSAAKGYGGMSDDDAHAIGVYLTTIAAVSNASAAPALEPVCTPP